MRPRSITLPAAVMLSAALVPCVSAQGKIKTNVTNFTYDKPVVEIAVDGTDFWAATRSGGVVRWDTLTGTFEKFTRADGLPDNHMTDVAVTSDGVVWAGTGSDGLGRFDPATRSWSILDASNSPLEGDLITAVEVDANDTLWVGTFENGLYRFDGQTWTNFDPNNSPISDRLVTSIVIGTDGAVWMGVFGEGVDRFDGVNWSNFDPANTGTPAGLCGDLTLDPNQMGLISHFVDVKAVDPFTGDLWVRDVDDGSCLLNGVTQYDGGQWRTFTQHNSGLISNFIEAIEVDSQGDVWFAASNGLSEMTDEGFNNFLGGADVIRRMGDTLLFGFFGGVVALEANGQLTEYFTEGLPDGLVLDVAISPLHLTERWFATRGGAARLRNNEFTEFTQDNSPLPTNDLRSVAIDSQGIVWLGSRPGGITRFDGQNWTTFNTSNSNLHSNRIETIAIDDEDNVWVGSGLLAGVSRFDGSGWTAFGFGSGFGNVSDIAIGRDGDIWFASDSGLKRLSGAGLRTFTTADGLPSDFTFAVDVAPSGEVWVGTFGDGVSIFDGATFTNVTTADGLSSDAIRAVRVDGGGSVWVGTLDDGLNRIRNGRIASFRSEDGLVNDSVYSIAIDRLGVKWIGTEMGVSALHRRPKVQTPRIRAGGGGVDFHATPRP